MANEKISSLPAAIALTGTELVPIVQDGINVKSTPAAFVSNGSLAISGTNLTYTGTLTGSTGIVNIGSGQIYKGASGNVGIGTSSPTAKLHALLGGTDLLILERNANNGVYARFKRPDQQYTLALNIDNNGNRTFDLYDNTNSHFVDQYLQGASGYRRFFTNGGERMRLDAVGNLGLGVTPSASNIKTFEIGYAGNVITTSSVNQLILGANAYYNAGWKYATTATATYYQQTSGTHSWLTAPSGTAGAAVSFTQAMTLDASGNLLVGTTSVVSGGGVLQLKSGITFPATQVASSDANTLDDYEEGTWTPAQDASLTVVGTFSSSGTYTKIGRQVTVTALLNGSTSIAASPGKIIATGSLPFATATGGGGTATNASLNSMCGVYCSNTAVYSGSSISATSQIGFTATYFV